MRARVRCNYVRNCNDDTTFFCLRKVGGDNAERRARRERCEETGDRYAGDDDDDDDIELCKATDGRC